MSNARVAGSAALVCVVFLAALLSAGLTPIGMDSQPVTFEAAVSPAANFDPRNETAIAVSLKNDQLMVGVSKLDVGGGPGPSGQGNVQVAYYFTADGGHSWGNGLTSLTTPQATWDRSSDPSVAADLDGNFYIGLLMLDNTGFNTGVYVLKSTDNGQTFSNPIPVVFDRGSAPSTALFIDKCYITVDTSPTSPFKNTVYAVWLQTEPLDEPEHGIHGAFLRPGASAFTEFNAAQSSTGTQRISHAGDMRGPSIATGPGGEIYVAWEGIGSPKTILFNASTDGGASFLSETQAASSRDVNIHNFIDALNDDVNPSIIQGVRRINSYPVIDVDRGNGPNRGNVYVVWAEAANMTDADVFLETVTLHAGSPPTHTTPVKVNNDVSAADQFFPWLSVDASSGDVEVAFYDRRDTGSILMNVYVARSSDGGASFSENRRITATPSDPTIQAMIGGSLMAAIGIGDYIGLAGGNGKAHALWTDTRSGQQQIYYGEIDYSPSSGGGGPGPGPANDACQTPRVINNLPFADTLDTRKATTAPDDPTSCSGGKDANSVWYSITPNSNTVYAVETSRSDYATVLSVYTGACGALTPVACSTGFPNFQTSNRSLVTFPARAGVAYFIEASGAAGGGALQIHFGYPTISAIAYTAAPDGSAALSIDGASFANGSVAVTVQPEGGDAVALGNIFYTGAVQGDGTITSLFATKKKLKKVVKPGRTVLVTVESPAGSGIQSAPFAFTR